MSEIGMGTNKPENMSTFGGMSTIKKTILESIFLKTNTFICKFYINKAVSTIESKVSDMLNPSNNKIFDIITY